MVRRILECGVLGVLLGASMLFAADPNVLIEQVPPDAVEKHPDKIKKMEDEEWEVFFREHEQEANIPDHQSEVLENPITNPQKRGNIGDLPVKIYNLPAEPENQENINDMEKKY